MKYLLDTHVWVDYLTGRYPRVVRRIHDSSPQNVCLSSVVMAALRYGAEKSESRARNHRLLDSIAREVPCIEFDLAAAAAYGRLRAVLEKRGRPIGPYDMMIAAHALSRRLVLVTDNVREFKRIGQLTVENWRR